MQTFREYGERFNIEEEFLDEKSNGFQLEKSLIRSPMALSRLCLVMAITTLFLTVQGQEVVKNGKRRLVDCHTFRGNSYLRLGWEWVKGVLYRGWSLFSTLFLCPDVDPEPAVASTSVPISKSTMVFADKGICALTIQNWSAPSLFCR